MGKLSSYNIVSSVSSGDYIPMFRSGVNNSAILPSSLFGLGGNSGKFLATDGSNLIYPSNFVYSGGRIGLGVASPTELMEVRGGRFFIDRTGQTNLGTSSNYSFSVSTYNSNSGSNWGELGLGIDEVGNTHLQTFNSKHLVIQDYGNNVGFYGHPNTNFSVSFKSGIGPSGNSSVNFGSTSYRWGSGYLDLTNSNRFVVNSGLSGAAFIWPTPISFSFGSGTVTGAATNASFEVEIMYPSIIDTSGAYPAARIRSKAPAGSGHPSGLTIDLKLNNISLWSVNSGNRLKMANNTRSGTQNSFDYSGVMQPGDVMTIDFVYVPSSVYANDIVIELATLAQR